jgi:hypothetical protein
VHLALRGALKAMPEFESGTFSCSMMQLYDEFLEGECVEESVSNGTV